MQPITSPGPGRSTADIILRNGDVLANDLVVANIEDAALARGGAAAVLVTVANSGNRSAVIGRAPDGTYSALFDPRLVETDFDSATLTRIRMAPTGELVFQSGTGLDSDRLHRIADGTLQTLAGAAPGPVFPEFRILGSVRIATGGLVAFVGGGQTCEVVVGADEPRVTCTNAIYVADANGVARLDDSELDLARQRPTAIRVEVDPTGAAWFSLPRRGNAPTLLRFANGEVTPILSGDTELPGVGLLNSVEAIGANAAGEVFIDGTLQVFEGERRPLVLGILRGESFAAFAKEGNELGGANVASLRGIAIDGAGRALFEARLGSPDAPDDQVNSLWLGNDGGLVEIVREGEAFPGEEIVVLRIEGSRLNAAGDVAFLTQLGTISDGVGQRQEVRATVRRADGRLVTIASSRHTGQFGTLSALRIVGYDDEANLLLIGTRSRSSDRVLLLGRSDQDAE